MIRKTLLTNFRFDNHTLVNLTVNKLKVLDLAIPLFLQYKISRSDCDGRRNFWFRPMVVANMINPCQTLYPLVSLCATH